RSDLEAREWALLQEHQEKWLAPFGDLAGFAEFRRGFVWGLMLTAAEFVERAEELFRITPLQYARLSAGSETMPSLITSPWLARLTLLSLASCALSCTDTGTLARSPYLVNLVALDLYTNQTHSRGLQALAASPHLGRLRELRLGWNGVGSAGLRALAASP